MLPRLAIANATTQTGHPPALSDVLVPGQRPAAEVIANLRAAVLLRLVETMLKQLQRGPGQGGAANALLEVLLDALKTLPPAQADRREGLRDIATLLARVPAEARPAVERLLHKTIAALPTRILVEILRNPESPAAQKLASTIAFLAAPDSDGREPDGERPRAISTLEARLAESHTERSRFPKRSGETLPRGDARALQAELRRLFEPGSSVPARLEQATTRHIAPSDVKVAQAEGATAASRGQPVEAGEQDGTDNRPTATAGRVEPPTKGETGTARGPQTATVAVATGDASEGVAVRPTVDGGDAATAPANAKAAQPAGPLLPDGGTTIRSRPEAITHFIAAVVASLSDEETQVLRTLLERPLARAVSVPDAVATASGPETPVDAMPDLPEHAAVRRPADAASVLVPASPVEDLPAASERTILPAVRETMATATAETRIEALMTQAAMREAAVPGFVPYGPVQDGAGEDGDEATPEGEDNREQSERDETEQDDDAAHSGGEAVEQEIAGTGDPASARQREKIAELVGPPDPGFVFYQKLGEYWA